MRNAQNTVRHNLALFLSSFLSCAEVREALPRSAKLKDNLHPGHDTPPFFRCHTLRQQLVPGVSDLTRDIMPRLCELSTSLLEATDRFEVSQKCNDCRVDLIVAKSKGGILYHLAITGLYFNTTVTIDYSGNFDLSHCSINSRPSSHLLALFSIALAQMEPALMRKIVDTKK